MINARIAAFLNWSESEANSFSLPSLRAMVRAAPASAERDSLLSDIDASIADASHWFTPAKPRRSGGR